MWPFFSLKLKLFSNLFGIAVNKTGILHRYIVYDDFFLFLFRQNILETGKCLKDLDNIFMQVFSIIFGPSWFIAIIADNQPWIARPLS